MKGSIHALMLFYFAAMLITSCASKAELNATRGELNAMRAERDSAKLALQECRTDLASHLEPPAPPPPAQPGTATPAEHRWTYNEQRDEMRDAVTRLACLTSTNEFQFQSPYEGGTRAEICFRQSPQFGFDAFVTINSGQFLCSSGCALRVKFDDGDVQRFAGNPPTGGVSTTVFVERGATTRFLTAVKQARRVIVETDFYTEGTRQFVFADVSGLTWELPPPPPPPRKRADPKRDLTPTN